MPISFTYVTSSTGEWGAGTGVQHSAAEVDGMFWDIQEFLNDLEDNPPEANSVANIFIDGTQLHFVLDDSTEFIVTVPQPPFRPAITQALTNATDGTYELLVADANTYKRFDGASDVTVVIADDLGMTVDSEIYFRSLSTGGISFEGSTSVVINVPTDFLPTIRPGGGGILKCVGDNEYDLEGRLVEDV